MTGSKTLFGPLLGRAGLRRRAGAVERSFIQAAWRRHAGGLPEHGHTDDSHVIRSARPGRIGVRQVGKNEVRDAVLRFAPSEDVERLPGRKDVAALAPGGRVSADDIDAVDRHDAEDPARRSASDRNGVAVAGRSGDPALTLVRVDREPLPGRAIQDRHVDHAGAAGRGADVATVRRGRSGGARGEQRGR